MNRFVLTTMCYLKKDNQTLLLHRIKKKNDINEGKWIGVGGKVEKGESIDECIKREILEETGYTAHHVKLHGFVTFPSLYHGEDEGMFVFSCDDFSGQLRQSDEGYLEWINDDDISSLNMWEGDYHFFDWLNDQSFHYAKIVYENDQLIEYQENLSI